MKDTGNRMRNNKNVDCMVEVRAEFGFLSASMFVLGKDFASIFPFGECAFSFLTVKGVAVRANVETHFNRSLI